MENYLEGYILSKLEELQGSREEGHIEPKGTTYKRLVRAMVDETNNTLNSLYKMKRIRVYNTVDDKGIELIKPN